VIGLTDFLYQRDREIIDCVAGQVTYAKPVDPASRPEDSKTRILPKLDGSMKGGP
jgi:hypothetical protein